MGQVKKTPSIPYGYDWRDWESIEAHVREKFVKTDSDGVYDERPYDAAMVMFIAGMTLYEIDRAMCQIWNAALDYGESDEAEQQ